MQLKKVFHSVASILMMALLMQSCSSADGDIPDFGIGIFGRCSAQDALDGIEGKGVLKGDLLTFIPADFKCLESRPGIVCRHPVVLDQIREELLFGSSAILFFLALLSA